MPIFPFTKRVSDNELLKTTCHLYRISLLKVIGLSLLCVMILEYFRSGKAYLPLVAQPFHQQSAMILLVLTLPLIGAMILIIDKVATATPFTMLSIIKETAFRFLSLIGSLISIALLPMILLGACLAAYYAMIYYHIDARLLFAWLIFSQLLIFTSFVANVYTPWLIFSDGLDANDAQSQSAFLVKHNFLRTFTHSLFAVLIITLLIQLPGLLDYYLAGMKIPLLWKELASDVLLIIIGPWSLVFLLANKYDLQIQKKDMKAPDNVKKVNIPSAIPKKSNNISF